MPKVEGDKENYISAANQPVTAILTIKSNGKSIDRLYGTNKVPRLKMKKFAHAAMLSLGKICPPPPSSAGKCYPSPPTKKYMMGIQNNFL